MSFSTALKELSLVGFYAPIRLKREESQLLYPLREAPPTKETSCVSLVQSRYGLDLYPYHFDLMLATAELFELFGQTFYYLWSRIHFSISF